MIARIRKFEKELIWFNLAKYSEVGATQTMTSRRWAQCRFLGGQHSGVQDCPNNNERYSLEKHFWRKNEGGGKQNLHDRMRFVTNDEIKGYICKFIPSPIRIFNRPILRAPVTSKVCVGPWRIRPSLFALVQCSWFYSLQSLFWQSMMMLMDR